MEEIGVTSNKKQFFEIFIPKDCDLNTVNKVVIRGREFLPVVHCAECTWSDWYETKTGKFCYCLETGQRGLTETDYCSFGEIDKEEQDDEQTN